MHVSFRFIGKIKINHEGNIFHVNTPGRYICSYQYWENPLSEALQGSIPLCLGTVSVDSL